MFLPGVGPVDGEIANSGKGENKRTKLLNSFTQKLNDNERRNKGI